ncbi:MAG: DMT family transporter [Tabrizicola sp.]|uniref:DMT family transporter n=1 Tax=Tabrizicola sp. TaxID=2005166 RepID=UPI002734CC37|nr:DMT family transporter [Tabrizicola sp.]MDP3263112.1 DMT family transporter [Tabrizicola sp.]MDP3649819.1 DMT family transporter [Paracoccaceae bacterium]MDZ4088780.1 DMT family transporter [Tabrizicola sp.]
MDRAFPRAGAELTRVIGGATRLGLLTALTMLAFAGNSILNRMAVGGGLIDPMGFAAIRVVAGAVVLVLLFGVSRRKWPRWQGRLAGVVGLSVYLIGFSLAYLALGAGTGALILFGAVQITMFAGALVAGEAVPPRRWAGAGVAFAGLVVLLAPAAAAPSLAHALMMLAAGIGWGIYSLAGRVAPDALAATTANFVLSVPLILGLALALPGEWSLAGAGLAALSGAVTSALGYALWYAILPELGAARAGLAQLTVPLIAALGGLAMLGEGIGLRFALATALVLGGVILGTRQSGLTSR